MSLIEEIRDYIDERIKIVDKDLRYDGAVFDSTKISFNNIDYAYKLVIGSTSVTRLDAIEVGDTAVTVTIFKGSGRDIVIDFDKLYCKAITMATEIIDQEAIAQDGFIKSIEVREVAPINFESDNNSVRINISLVITSFLK